jgi:UDP-N-acetylglucosamine--N-acetylmuramyl-(pentapeptide) pyrophosphoryl-undecaprenol N-acetylglucosamine transferase
MVLSGNQYAKIYLVSKVKSRGQYFNLNVESRKTLLVLGGSLGARRMNQLIEKELENCFAKCSDYLAMRKVIFRRL